MIVRSEAKDGKLWNDRRSRRLFHTRTGSVQDGLGPGLSGAAGDVLPLRINSASL